MVTFVLGWLMHLGISALVTFAVVWIAAGSPIVRVRRRLLGTMLLQHLAMLLRLRMPLHQGLDECRQALSRGSRNDVQDVAFALDAGALLGDALAYVPRPPQGRWADFVDLRRALLLLPVPTLVRPAEAEVLRVGEKGGDLEGAVNMLLEERSRHAELRLSLYGAVSYMVAVVLFALIIATGIITFIVPKFKAMFAEMGIDLPPATVFVLNVADFFKTGWYYPVIAVILLFLLRRYALRPMRRTTHFFTRSLQRIVYLIPFVHGGMRRSLLGEFYRELAMLLRVGTPPHRALRIIAEGTMNPWVRTRIEQAATLCEQGVGLGKAIDEARLDRRGGWFGSPTTPGEIADALHRLGEDYTAQAGWTTALVARLVPPVVILCLALLVGALAFGLFSPLVRLMASIQTGAYQ